MEDIEKIVSESEGKQLEISGESQENLRTICKWMKFMVIMAFIFNVGFVLLIYSELEYIYLLLILSLILALMPLYPIYKFWKFVSTTKTALQNADNQEMENAVSYLAQATRAMACLVVIISYVIPICALIAIFIMAD